MNVGSILNGDSPQDESLDPSKVSDVDRDEADPRSSRPSVNYRQSIISLLNDAPSNGDKPEETRRNNYASLVLQTQDSSEISRSSGQIAADYTRISLENDRIDDQHTEDDEDDDVDADAEAIDRELTAVSLREAKQLNTRTGKDAAVPSNKHAKSSTRDASPAASRRNFLNGELEKLRKLKGEKKKPHRYDAPPTWAQQWIPPSQQGTAHSKSHESSAANASFLPLSRHPATISLKPVFNYESMTLTDLECLITGVIPPQSTIRTIAEWLYANFVEILLENRQYVELELKFGTIISKRTGSRIDIGVSTECIYTNTSDTRFEMGVHEVGWNDMKTYLDELEKAYADRARKDPSKAQRKFSLTESSSTDYFYQITERNEKPKKIRVSKDNLLSPPRHVAISKRRLSDLYIHVPSAMYDLRLSLSIEFPVDEDSIDPIMKKNKPSLQRGKKRVSYSHAPTVTRFDFTEVSSPRPMKNKAGRSVVANEKSYELELEIDTFQIFRGFDRIRDGSDSIRFEELVEIFLNNARCLNNRVTKLASK